MVRLQQVRKVFSSTSEKARGRPRKRTSRVARAEDEEQPEADEWKDAEGLKDHPAYRRYPGSALKEGETKDFEAFEFPVSSEETSAGEGRFYTALYRYPDKLSCTQLIRNYENAFKAAGLKISTGSDLPSKAVDAGLSGDRWVTGIGKGKKGGMIYLVQTCDTAAHSGEVWGKVIVVEKTAMEQVVEIDADGMMAEIQKTGRVALYGIHSATGKADITPDSARMLAQIAEVLAKQPGWKLRVEGHTDNVGKPKVNQDLSRNVVAL
jgi:OOP family OmpA-OmpF porin